ncbi:MAG TPA: glycine zipper 2TM domain-containing protein [Sphingomonadaceae bacterium]|nr:glycine zipper 2TM domain-containing protein [Sphingomonadaceae bacterium]
MIRFACIAAVAALSGLAVAAPASAQSRAETARFEAAQQRLDNELAIFRTEFDHYQQARERDARYGASSRYSDDRYENGYDPARNYRDGPEYRERVLANDDRVYRGTDGRYYCQRSDGTTGLIIGAAGGGILGNVIDGGHSRTVGTLIGGALGALAGKSIDQNNAQLRCR